jgi:chaperonin cofactor prefoldin
MNLSLQDMLVMWASIVGPLCTLMGFMWYHFNNLGNGLRGELSRVEEKLDKKIDNLGNDLKGELNRVEEKLDKKIDNLGNDLRGELNRVEEKLDKKIDNLGNDLRGELNRAEKRLDEKIDTLDKKIDTLRSELNGVEKRLDEKISSVEKGLGEKIDAARDRISRIEGQLVPAKMITFEEIRPREITEQRNAIKQS